MRLAVSDAAGYGRADAGGFLRIDGVHIERKMKTGGVRADQSMAPRMTAGSPRSSMSRIVKG